MIICALDYQYTAHPLTCTVDAQNMRQLAAACEVQDVVVMLNEECTAENVRNTIYDVGSRCQEEDFFIFFYSGHGTNVADLTGDEADGQDEAFCFVDPSGHISLDTVMTDDDFSATVTSYVPLQTRILILTDCCHSGTIADLGRAEWTGRDAISITGCLDGQTSGDMGKGGIFTQSMLLGIDKLAQLKQQDYSIGALYNATLKEDEKVFHCAQDIHLETANGCQADAIAWPLIPVGRYVAPLRMVETLTGGNVNLNQSLQSGDSSPGLSTVFHSLAQTDPAFLVQHGLPPALTTFIRPNASAASSTSPNYLSSIGHQNGCPLQ